MFELRLACFLIAKRNSNRVFAALISTIALHLLRKSKIFERMSVPDGPVLRIVDLMKDTNLQREVMP